MSFTTVSNPKDMGAAFNDLGLVDIKIKTPLGTMEAHNLGPADVILLATPGNSGNVMDVWEGSTGQVLANKSYKVKNWSVTIRLLRHSLDYCKGTYLIQEILNGNVTACGLQIINRNFGRSGTTDTTKNEMLEADTAFLVNFAGIEVGSGASGDFEITFKCSNARFTSGVYTDWSANLSDDEFPRDKSLVNTGPDRYEGVNYPTGN